MSEYLLRTARRLREAGNVAEAVRLYGEVLRLDPRQFEALFALGSFYLHTSRLASARRFLGEAVEADPASAEAQYMLGCVLQASNEPGEALLCFERALALQPGFTEAKVERAVALRKLKRTEEALTQFDALLAADPSNYGALVNRGYLLRETNRFEDALADFDKAAELNPNAAEVLINRGAVHYLLKHVAAAVADCEKALASDASLPYVRGSLAHYRLQCCDWSHLEADRAALSQGVRRRERIVQPYLFLALSDSPAEQLQCARNAIAHETPASASPLWRGERYGHERIRIAYLSADYRDHAVARLVAGVFEHHDTARFETIGIALNPQDKSDMRARIARAFPRFIDASAMSSTAIAEIVRKAEIDIAVDLTCFTAGGRPGIFAARPAPVQVNFLGYPGTMGAGFYDYILADPVVIPPEQHQFYSEKVVTLPDAYQCNDSKRLLPQAVPARAAQGLPEQGFVFCCFNNNNKIAPPIFDIWMRLLGHVEGSVLWLLADNEDAKRNLMREAEARGIASERLVFARRVSPPEHLARHRLADLFLDTLPYGAHTTASDALWLGLPVLTCLGANFPGRVAASVNRAAGMTETTVASLGQYEALALALARDPARLSALKEKLAANRESCALFDTARFTRNLESAYTRMWQRANQGEAPQSFAV